MELLNQIVIGPPEPKLETLASLLERLGPNVVRYPAALSAEAFRGIECHLDFHAALIFTSALRGQGPILAMRCRSLKRRPKIIFLIERNPELIDMQSILEAAGADKAIFYSPELLNCIVPTVLSVVNPRALSEFFSSGPPRVFL